MNSDGRGAPAVAPNPLAGPVTKPAGTRRGHCWSWLLVLGLDTGAPDLVVVPAATLAALRRDDWQVPAEIERLAGAVSVSQRADRAGARTAAGAGAGR